ncbi:putative tRNA pseudouridine synthase Pus10 [Cimex lectularius]|uniref:tRNA pseudouridine(55) synthase n=1 Tax=Cimex lectularius TaxID=79782 RepID=A0A8I6TEW5_CIMLE|nr:putative tRNA pseudouridine synthase Pus10 [Cimex lectularius]
MEEVYVHLKKNGCCDKCCLRLLGETDPSSFRDCEAALKKRGVSVRDEDEENGVKHRKCNPCVACLGLLHPPYSETIFNKVLEEANKVDFDSDTFYLALTTPVTYFLRSLALWVDLKDAFPDFVGKAFPLGVVTIGIKDVWKFCYLERLQCALKKKYTLMSDLRITFCISYVDEAKECECLFKMFPETFSKTKNKKYLGSIENFSRKCTENVLKEVDDQLLKDNYKIPPDIPDNSVEFRELLVLHNSIFIAGRYNKWSRVLPQTPWILGGERKMESSVQELICDPILELTKAQEYKFASSGREDVDVRNIGRGRPFYVELCNPKRTTFSFKEMRSLENAINENSTEKIFVRDLQIINKHSVSSVKLGEEKKTKQYCALCIRPDGKPVDNLEKLETLKDVEIQQSTPLRVLHRRPVAVRLKIIHWMKVTRLEDEPNKFILRLNTQAGTYIKEFIHGDFGRTKPSLGELLGNIDLDILALDVEEISLDWPPQIDYTSEPT